jgi:hypothetical protein
VFLQRLCGLHLQPCIGMHLSACTPLEPYTALHHPAFPLCPLHCSNQPTFDLEPAALEKRYKLLQWQLHPDKTVNRSPEEQQFSAEQATRVNQAYGVLRHPLSRANYMVGHSHTPGACGLTGSRLS